MEQSNLDLNSNITQDVIFIFPGVEYEYFTINLKENISNLDKIYFDTKKDINYFSYAFLLKSGYGKTTFSILKEKLVATEHKMLSDCELKIADKEIGGGNIMEKIINLLSGSKELSYELLVYRSCIFQPVNVTRFNITTKIKPNRFSEIPDTLKNLVTKTAKSYSFSAMGEILNGLYSHISESMLNPKIKFMKPEYLNREIVVEGQKISFDCDIFIMHQLVTQKRKFDEINKDGTDETSNSKRVKMSE